MRQMEIDTLDLVDMYLCEAQYYLDTVEHDYFTEADGGDDPVVAKSKGPLKSAIDAMLSMIKSMVARIRDFFERIFMSRDEKSKFNQFKEAVKDDPDLRGKKITVKTYRDTMAMYDALEKELEGQARQDIDQNAVDKLTKKVEATLGHEAKVIASPIVADMLIRRSMASYDEAKKLSNALNMDAKFLGQLDKLMGEKAAKGLRKDVEACARKVSVRKLLLRVRKGKQQCLEQATDDYMEAMSALMQGKTTKLSRSIARQVATAEVKDKGIKNTVKAGLEARKIAKDIKGTKKVVGKAANDYEAGVRKAGKAIEKSNAKYAKNKEKADKMRGADAARREEYLASRNRDRSTTESVNIMGIRD